MIGPVFWVVGIRFIHIPREVYPLLYTQGGMYPGWYTAVIHPGYPGGGYPLLYTQVGTRGDITRYYTSSIPPWVYPGPQYTVLATSAVLAVLRCVVRAAWALSLFMSLGERPLRIEPPLLCEERAVTLRRVTPSLLARTIKDWIEPGEPAHCPTLAVLGRQHAARCVIRSL